MNIKDYLILLVLAALWGGSYLFMRVAAPEFGPLALIELRVLIAAALLLPVVLARGATRELRTHARALSVMGVLNSALPFTLIAYATLSVSAGYAAILNATSPFFAALVARAWLGERLDGVRLAGLAVGFGGVVILAGDQASLAAGNAALAVAAALAAAALYGVAANYSRRHLAGIEPVTAAAGSQLGAALVLAPATVFVLPASPPSAAAWAAALALGAVSTGLAYVLYFRLLATAGATRTILVTFLIPVFGMLWGGLALGEAVTPHMATGTCVILAGTAMTTGLAGRSARRDC